jgi:hypothetical protein
MAHRPQYTQALMANGIDDDSTICTLSDGDLVHCGVDNLGHRRRMLTSDQGHEQDKTTYLLDLLFVVLQLLLSTQPLWLHRHHAYRHWFFVAGIALLV